MQQVVTEKFEAIKVFSATMAKDREMLGEKVSDWIARNPKNQITSTVVAQSSDQAFHCTTIVVFYTKG